MFLDSVSVVGRHVVPLLCLSATQACFAVPRHTRGVFAFDLTFSAWDAPRPPISCMARVGHLFQMPAYQSHLIYKASPDHLT